MPYIEDARRLPIIEGMPADTVGELTYIIQQHLCAYLENKQGSLRYEHIAEALGALEGAKADFIDRIVRPYEKRKRRENGDAWGYDIVREAKHGS